MDSFGIRLVVHNLTFYPDSKVTKPAFQLNYCFIFFCCQVHSDGAESQVMKTLLLFLLFLLLLLLLVVR